MMSPVLVFERGTMIRCLDPDSVKCMHATATLMATSPIDLLVAARGASVDGTIYGLVSKLLSPKIAAEISPNNALYNNPHEWFTTLLGLAKTAPINQKKMERLVSRQKEVQEAPAGHVNPIAKVAAEKFAGKSAAGKTAHCLRGTNSTTNNKKTTLTISGEVLRLLLMTPTISNQEIFLELQKTVGLSETKRHFIPWYRCYHKRNGRLA